CASFMLQKKDIIAFSILYFLISISIVSNIFIVIGTVMAERLLYSPSLAICLVIAVLLTKAFQTEEYNLNTSTLNLFLKNNLRPFVITGAILILFSFKTITRQQVWENDMHLYESGVHDSPNSSRCRYF